MLLFVYRIMACEEYDGAIFLLSGISEALGRAGKKVGERTYDLLQSQIWALLPSFCDEAQDIQQSFPKPVSQFRFLIKEEANLVTSAIWTFSENWRRDGENAG